ncbi:probable LRR receptor-like serine/threonine-protein kinase At3g47570 [Hibiscus syriacus]|uniref:probable LRR receptor-like serine/threonine-protein kinase At3g47570 n=1 Tax=Hibiscus syriacus TaxID=106335 RepID=UPI001924D497|nr:probable LRR receptor-like serine/threonine-protein kinase At3g47570 [Hibiscus syriacus]
MAIYFEIFGGTIMAFKKDPNTYGWTLNDSLHFCNWQGVTCGRQHRRVTALRLSSLKLAGDLSPHIANLTFLRVINLGNNSFCGNALGGEIHAELGSLSRLQSLLLAANNFIGTVPPSLGNISSLLHLSVYQNHLEGNIPSELGQLSNFKFLQLGLNFSGTVPKQLYNISSIYFLSVLDNQLRGQISLYIGLTLPNLEVISLAGNKSSGPIPTTIVNSSRLIKLDMGGNSLSGSIPKNLGSLQNIQFLSFSENFLESSDDFSFHTSLTNCTNLRTLLFSYNNLTGVLPDSIGNLSANLNYLMINSNYISGTIPKEIGNLVGLELLALDENMLTGCIPDSIGKCSKLKSFHAYTNRITGEIPHSLGNITELIVFDLSDNFLEGGKPAFLGNFIRLEVLDLSQNRLNDTIPKKAIGLCSFLRALSFASNSLTGTLPPELETMNSFEGTIPSSFRKLRSLQELDVSHNNLSGQIQEFLGELPLFTNLNLSFSSFEGKVPTKGVFNNISAFSIVGNNELCGGIKPLRLTTCPTEIAKKRKIFPRRAIIVTSFVLFVVLFLTCLFAIKRRGRYGSVYKGILSSDDQTEVAVKVLNLQQRGADQSFKSECEALRKLRHRNLVKVITSCSSIDFQGNDFKALVLELMPNGSLETWLHPSSTKVHNSPSLNLIQRLNIAIDVASALDYIHSQFDKPVVHCDLKPSNILLDADLTAHISDFGLTRFLSETI